MNTHFKKQPTCELVKGAPAEHFTCRNGRWLFVSTEAEELGDEYHFEIDDFFKSPASTVDWLAHLNEKGWFEPKEFFCYDAPLPCGYGQLWGLNIQSRPY
jgi:hypothetical protein